MCVGRCTKIDRHVRKLPRFVQVNKLNCLKPYWMGCIALVRSARFKIRFKFKLPCTRNVLVSKAHSHSNKFSSSSRAHSERTLHFNNFLQYIFSVATASHDFYRKIASQNNFNSEMRARRFIEPTVTANSALKTL